MAVSPISGGSLDVASIVNQLMTVEAQPMTQLKQDLGSVQSQVSVWGKLQSSVSSLQDAAGALGSVLTWKASTAKSADDTAVSISASTGAAAGSYSVQVSQLAKAQSVVGTGYASATAAVGGGSLKIQLGAVSDDGTTFTADPARAATVTVPDGATLTQVRDAINNAGAGVTASIVNDGTASRLVMNSAQSGQKNAFQITATPSGSDGASTLANFAVSATQDGGANGTRRTQAASDALLKVNGLDIRSATNAVSGAIDGVTFNVKKTGADPVQIDVGTDTTAIKGSIDKFVGAYNSLASLLKTDLAYDQATKTAGPLQGNAVAVRMQSQMRDMLRTVSGTSGLSTLSEAGISIQKDGTLSVDATKMTTALNNPSALRGLFAGMPASATNAVPGSTAGGVAGAFRNGMGAFLGSTGPIQGATNALSAQQKRLSDQQDDLQDRLDAKQTALTAQYSALNAKIQQIQSSYSSIAGLLSG